MSVVLFVVLVVFLALRFLSLVPAHGRASVVSSVDYTFPVRRSIVIIQMVRLRKSPETPRDRCGQIHPFRMMLRRCVTEGDSTG